MFSYRNAGAAKLTPERVGELRRLYFEEGWSQGRLARHFLISVGQVGRIVRGESWQKQLRETQAPTQRADDVLERLLQVQAEALPEAEVPLNPLDEGEG